MDLSRNKLHPSCSGTNNVLFWEPYIEIKLSTIRVYDRKLSVTEIEKKTSSECSATIDISLISVDLNGLVALQTASKLFGHK